MTAIPNQSIYRFYAPVYDWLFRPVTIRARSDMVGLLALQQGERLLIPGVGTGLDLPLIPPGVRVTAGDISSHMLRQAQSKTAGQEIELKLMDAQHLEFTDGCFDAVLFTLVLSVVPDARATFGEAWRVPLPGGRIALFDKFIPMSVEEKLLVDEFGNEYRLYAKKPGA